MNIKTSSENIDHDPIAIFVNDSNNTVTILGVRTPFCFLNKGSIFLKGFATVHGRRTRRC